MQLHIGGMMFNTTSRKGIKRKDLPSPKIVDFDACSSYEDIVMKGKELFFPQESDNFDAYSLAGSSGVPFDIADKENWVLGDFLKEHGFQPSKLRLYILYNPISLVIRS